MTGDISKQHPFLKLPAELRLRVYKLILAPICLPENPQSIINRHSTWNSQSTLPSEGIKHDRESRRTIALPSASTLRPYSGWLLSSRQIYTEVEVELLKRYTWSINQLKTQWPTDAFHLELSTPKCFRDTNRMSIGIPYDRVTTLSAYHRERIWSRHACFCSSAPTLETSSHVKAVVTYLLDNLPSFALHVAHLRPPIVENHFHNCVEERLLVVMSNALEDALVARDRRPYRPDPRKVGGRIKTGTTLSQDVLSVSSRWRDTIEYHVQI